MINAESMAITVHHMLRNLNNSGLSWMVSMNLLSISHVNWCFHGFNVLAVAGNDTVLL